MPEEEVFDEEELVATAPAQRNWLGIILALLVIIFIFAMIIMSAIILMPKNNRKPVTGRPLTLDDVVNDSFQVPVFNGSWISDYQLVYRDASGGLTVMNLRDRTTRMIMSNITFGQWDVHHYSLSPDLKYVLLAHDYRKVYRHTFLAKFTLFDIIRGNPVSVTPTPDDRGHPSISWAGWAPDGGATLITVYRGDIYIQPSAERRHNVRKLTDSGQPGVVVNGVPDWLYEEEILGADNAMWFSSTGDKLVFASFNDSSVQAAPLVTYTQSRLEQPVKWLRYPTTGSVNPSVTLWVVHLHAATLIKQDLKPPTELRNTDYYFTSVVWVDEQTVAVTWINRPQNSSFFTECDIALGYCVETHVEDVTIGWLDVQPAPIYASAGTYVTILPVRDAAVGTYRHACRRDADPHRITPLTTGPLHVTRILAWDRQHDTVYVMAAPMTVAGERHLYSTNSSATMRRVAPRCLTCRQNTSIHYCLFSSITLSRLFSHYVQECLGPGIPWIRVFSLSDNRLVANLTNHPDLRELVASVALPQIETRSYIISDGVNASVRLLLPPGFSRFDHTTYPMLLHVYGGPGYQQVSQRWQVDWNSFMASGRDFVCASIDASGSGFRGEALKHRVHKRLGTIEVEEQLEVLVKLLESEYYIDMSRVVVWGWSYGGYAAAMTLSRDSQRLLRGAIAVAPVTDWRLYDSAYTERFMGLPDSLDNSAGYDRSELGQAAAARLAGRRLLLVHGSIDDNVHLDHTMKLSQALTKQGVHFQQQIYPNEGHSLKGVQSHLYELLEAFIRRSFLPDDDVIDRALVKYFKKRQQAQA